MSNYSVSVTIGRNVNGGPMAASAWVVFQSEAEAALRLAFRHNVITPDGFERHAGSGSWLGVPEDSFRVAGFGLDEVDAASVADTVELLLPELCERYGQDAIAVTVGSARLV